jgi:hypothetical protein
MEYKLGCTRMELLLKRLESPLEDGLDMITEVPFTFRRMPKKLRALEEQFLEDAQDLTLW